MAENRKQDTSVVEEIRTMQEVRDEWKLTRIRELPIDQISDFPAHPYKVKDDRDMMDLVESIRKSGVLTPVTVRKIPGGRFEMISGHRRKRACELIGLRTIRGEVLNVDDNVAAIMMCDSNLNRSVILPSEKAFAYKMRLEAMNRQGKRSDLTSTPLVSKLRANEELGLAVGESREQIRRYIRLTNLIHQFLDMVDEGRLPMRTAVDISYLPENLQEDLYACIKQEAHIPSHSQVVQMRRLLQQEKLTKDSIAAVLQEKKSNQKVRIVLRDEHAMSLIPENLTGEKCEEYIIRALEHYRRYQEGKQKNRETAVIKRRQLHT